RLIVHSSQMDAVMQGLQKNIAEFVQSGAIVNPLTGQPNDYGYGPLIDADAYARFERAKSQVQQEWGMVWGGQRLMPEYPDAYYVAPALARMTSQTAIMHEETFAPLLYLVPYEGGLENALPILNAPDNAGLVAGIYTQSQVEADMFAMGAEAGHVLINSPRGTGTPAFGMGFGGNKDSGEGEILNAADPLRPFVRDTHFRRIAQNTAIPMDM
ncbi:MAG: aldehyde dehydrogenase family protein, partial [Alphaproteobacteria bacterium]|nr:aldehyde dehydrogenase family protein [Alphaproteobacteria bacterium]